MFSLTPQSSKARHVQTTMVIESSLWSTSQGNLLLSETSYSRHPACYRKNKTLILLWQDFATPSLEFTELPLDTDHEDEEEPVETAVTQFCLRRHWETRYQELNGLPLICGVLIIDSFFSDRFVWRTFPFRFFIPQFTSLHILQPGPRVNDLCWFSHRSKWQFDWPKPWCNYTA